MRLSLNFTVAECEKSQTALRHDIDNYLPTIYANNAKNVAEYILEPCRKHFIRFISPSSWYRCAKLNDIINSGKSSQHLTASAVDFEIQGIDNMELAEYIRDELEFDQLILEYYDGTTGSGWVHCSYAENNRGEVLHKQLGKPYKKGLAS